MVKSVHVIDGNQADVVAPVLEREMSALREQHGPMIRATFPFGGDGWLAIGYKAARDLMQHPDFSTGGHGPALPRMRENGGARPPWPRTLSMMDPPEHTAKRRLLSKHLSVKRVMALEPRVAVEVDGLLDEVIAHGQGVDIVRHFTDVLPLVGLCGLLGTDLAEREQFVPQAKALIAGKVTDPDEGDRLVASIVEYFADLVLRRRQEPRDDLLSALIYDSEAGVLTDEDLAFPPRGSPLST